MAEMVKSANAVPTSCAMLPSVGVGVRGRVLNSSGCDGSRPGCARRMGGCGREPHNRFGRGKNTLAHTNKSSDECDIPTDRMLLEMCTNKGKLPTMHTDYQWQKYNPLSFVLFFIF